MATLVAVHETDKKMVQNATDRINSATGKGEILVNKLNAHAKAKYRQQLKIRRSTIGVAATIVMLIVVFAVKHYAGASEPGTQCITTLDHGALQTSCK